jgi:hypothetical protein
MLNELKVGRLLELHERLTIARGTYEAAQSDLQKSPPERPQFYSAPLSDLTLTYGEVCEVEAIAAAAGLSSTRTAARRTKTMLANNLNRWSAVATELKLGAADCGTLFRHLSDIVSRIRDDCAERLYYQIPEDNAALYQPKTPAFGEDVERVFPIAIDDIAGAGRCLALGEGTATVFHLMRVMEAGFRAIAKELGVDYKPSWESYIRALNTLLDSANYPNLTADQKAKRPWYQDVLGDLVAIKQVWRNPTMHIVKSYDAESAKKIYVFVESFMKHLAEKLDPIPPLAISTGPTSE